MAKTSSNPLQVQIALAVLLLLITTVAAVADAFSGYWVLIGATSAGYLLIWTIVHTWASKLALRHKQNVAATPSARIAFIASEIAVIPLPAALLPLELLLTGIFAAVMFVRDHPVFGLTTLVMGSGLALLLLTMALPRRHGGLR